MARAYRPPASFGPILTGAVGGGLAAAVALTGLALLGRVHGIPATATINALGALAVRWLQDAEDGALAHFYADATPGGIVLALGFGALAGALFSGLLDRLPRDHPLPWGLVSGAAAGVVTWWRVLPALDPVVIRTVTATDWILGAVVYGGLVGAWVEARRRVRQREDAAFEGAAA
ncbi:MAG: hypothetical protein ACE5EL_00360 [Anaerolineae bacterium]